MAITLKYLRKDHIIRTLETKEGDEIIPARDEHFRSINQAKKASRKLQLENGGLGMGSLKLVDKLPALETENE